ncbi:MAG: hypothetical protein COA32_11930 [Fluviicola sp.]|nr:MAG: hypothetical protein COA32_11930 [Fluviicola sp.]
MKKLSLISILLLVVFNINAQSTRIWLTVNDQDQIQVIESNFNIVNIKKALPASKLENLQKVYEFEIDGDYSGFIEYVNKTKALVNPEVIEEFTLLYEPNDYNLVFSDDYALDLINAKEAWDISKGSPVIKIGVLDSNFDPLHEDLEGKVSYMATDISGTNYNHGIAVAATAAGGTNNGVGKSSIGNKCEVMLYGMNYNHLLEATYAGARVVNLSWASGCYYNTYYQNVVNEVYNNGTVIIAAAGNGPTCGGADNYVYPASFENVIAVSSVGPNDNHQRYPEDEMSTHQHNDSVDLVAPGYDVALAIANNNYTTGNGTSFASPYVAGTVGLMLSVNPCLSPAQVEMILKATAVSVDDQNPLYLGELGAGRLDARAAVQMAKDLIPIDFDVFLNEATCTNGVPNITVQLNEGDINNHNLQWSDGSSDWTRNNLNTGTYNFTISSPDGCSINQDVTFAPSGPHFDYPNSVFIDDENFTLTDSNNDGEINVRGTVVIGNDIDYNINGLNLYFTDNSDLSSIYPNSGIVVERGSNLNIEDAYLSSVGECTNTWGGIELWSESGSMATVSIENTTIENAKVAVSNISKYAFNNELDMKGGLIYLKNSTVTNSKIGVNIIEKLGQPNSHNIVGNTFLNNENIISPTYINLNGVKYVNVKENTFNGSESVASASRGTGIRAVNSNLNMMITKPNIQDLSFNNTYNHLYLGVNIENSTKSFLNMRVYNSLFNNVEKCININGQYNGEIALNEFNITTGSSQDHAFGIKSLGENNLLITENIFFGEASINNYGLISESNTVGEGLIKLNSFEGEFVNAINFVGANSFEEVSCNNFNIHGQYDWFIDKSDSGEFGSVNVNKELNINQFSDSNNVVFNLKNHQDNQVFHYEDAYQYLPQTIGESITVENIQIEIKRENYCHNTGNRYSVLRGEESTDEESLSTTNENDVIETIAVYPNPSNGVVNITNTEESNIDQVFIMTIEGKIIETISWNQQQSIDLTSYPAGTYVVGLQLGDSVKTERVVIL